jgi:IS1 family transposase
VLHSNYTLLESAVERNPKALCLFHFGNINESDGTCYVKIVQFPLPIDFKFFLRQFVIDDRRMPSARWERSLVNVNPPRTPADMPIGPPEIHWIVRWISNVKGKCDAVNKWFIFSIVSQPYILSAAPLFYVYPLDKFSPLNCGALAHGLSSLSGFHGLPAYGYRSSKGDHYKEASQNVVGEGQLISATPRLRLFLAVWMEVGSLIVACIGTAVFVVAIIKHNNRGRWVGGGLALVGYLGFCTSLVSLFIDRLPWEWLQWLQYEDEHSQNEVFHGSQLYYRKFLTDYTLCTTVNDMANVLPKDKQIAVIGALAEGSSIRSIERITGVHRDTIMRLGVKIGKGCAMLLDSKMQDLDCNYLQLDELWGFIGKKERHCSVDDSPEFGDVWTFCAIDSETKLVPSFRCGKRTHELATEFAMDIAGRMRHRVQVSTDAMHSYIGAMELAFGADVDYGQCVKVYVHDAAEHPERKYSAPSFASAYRRPITGNPEMGRVSTSHVERLNATTRLHVKRLNRLTLAFSKKLENFQAAVGLHFAYYNFVLRHGTLRCTPAMAAGIERDFWSVADLVEAVS